MIGSGPVSAAERLRHIDAMMAVAHPDLDLRHLLDDLLEQVCELLHADTAVILLADHRADHLEVAAAQGVEKDVEQAVRLPIGVGFAGRIAQRREPLLLDNVSRTELANTILSESGVCSLLGMPMLAGTELIGVLHVGSRTPRQFAATDIELLQKVAQRAALAIRTRTVQIDHTAALALQRSLLPGRLPAVPGLDLAARYLPGHRAGIGGDWYDVFALTDGWLGVVVGDVTGHGLAAAVVMGRARSALRAYAIECPDPADTLTRLDQKLQHFEAGSMATVLYAMISPDRRQMKISLAGHPAPVLAAPDRPAATLPITADFPLGVTRRAPRVTTTVDLPDEATLVCFTDGLVERRDEVIDTGLSRLTGAIVPGDAEEICTAVMATVDHTDRADDIALLVARRVVAAAQPV